MIIISVEEEDIQDRPGQGAHAIVKAVHRLLRSTVRVIVNGNSIQFSEMQHDGEVNQGIETPNVVRDFVRGLCRSRRPFKFPLNVPEDFLA